MQLNKPRWALGSTKRKQSHFLKVLLWAIYIKGHLISEQICEDIDLPKLQQKYC